MGGEGIERRGQEENKLDIIELLLLYLCLGHRREEFSSCLTRGRRWGVK